MDVMDTSKRILARLGEAFRRFRDAGRSCSCTSDAPSLPRVVAADRHPGQFVSGSYASAAGDRRYKLYIPTGCGERRLPLVVMLHGCNQTADAFASATRMNALAEERQCFVLYP